MTLNELRNRWRELRDEYALLRAQIDAATLIDQLLTELEAVNFDQNAALLTLTQAAAACGYSADHIGRLVRTGQLTNYGRRHAPRVRMGDLPRRIRRWPEGRSDGASRYDPIVDAGALRDGRRYKERDGIA